MTSEGDSPMANLRRKNGRDKAWKVKFFGVGNESWGCGGSMRPEYYSDLYRRYSTYCRNYDSNVLFKIASGASDYDYNWTETLMKQIGGRMDGISLHYYTVGDWNNKGSATDFNTEDYYWTLGKCLEIEDVVKKHIAIMDKYDPKKNIALMVDEWGHLVGCGTRYDPRPSVPAKHDARRFRGRSYPTCLPQIYGPGENDQHRTDCQCIAVHDPHERQGHGAYAYLPCVRDVQSSSRRYLFADGSNLRQGESKRQPGSAGRKRLRIPGLAG